MPAVFDKRAGRIPKAGVRRIVSPGREEGSMHRVPITTSDGSFTACFSERGLAGLDFPSARRGRPRPPEPNQKPLPAEIRRWSALTGRALREALSGRSPRRLPPLDLTGGTTFQQSVWGALSRIPMGQTWTYAELARAIRCPRAVRAVGRACGANPIPVLVPCHRVQRAGGGLGGFSAGLEWKRLLLEREGVRPPS